MSIKVESWWTLRDESGIRLPFIVGYLCDAEHKESRLVCGRADMHTGRHAATSTDGTVWAVWS